MTARTYRFEVAEARSFTHPALPSITKHSFFVQAAKLPRNLPDGANAREAVGMNRRVYREVTESLRANEAWPGTFDLMNLGITILADNVTMIEKKVFDVVIRDEDGIVNGSHTAKIIERCIEDNSVHPSQHVEVKIITGVEQTQIANLKADIAKGQNSGIMVKDQSIYDTQGVFEPLREIVSKTSWSDRIAWRESDAGEYDVRDLISVLEAFNVIDYPNDSGNHPIQAYEKWSAPLKKYADDHRFNDKQQDRRKYGALEPLLIDMLNLYDRIRHDFRNVFNEKVSSGAGRMRIVEEAPANREAFDFPFSGQSPEKYRLTKGATFPILAAFRNFVRYDAEKNRVEWVGGFDRVKQVWKEAAPELVRETAAATKEIGRTPDVIGKSRAHWANLHRTLENRLLRMQLAQLND